MLLQAGHTALAGRRAGRTLPWATLFSPRLQSIRTGHLRFGRHVSFCMKVKSTPALGSRPQTLGAGDAVGLGGGTPGLMFSLVGTGRLLFLGGVMSTLLGEGRWPVTKSRLLVCTSVPRKAGKDRTWDLDENGTCPHTAAEPTQ